MNSRAVAATSPEIGQPIPSLGIGTRISYGAGAMANGIKSAAFSSY